MPDGKAAGERCIQLDRQDRCQLFGDPRRPAVCTSLRPTIDMCGTDRHSALRGLTQLEAATRPTTAIAPHPGSG